MRIIGPYSILLAAIILPLYHGLSSEISVNDILQSKPETHIIIRVSGVQVPPPLPFFSI